jgi:hypothetical protein
MTLPEDLRQLLLAFNEHGVEYLIVGGYAVGTYAEPRATKDVDLFIRSESRNSEAVFRPSPHMEHRLQVCHQPILEMTPTRSFRLASHLLA